MSRPKPTILIQKVDHSDYSAEQVLKADATYAVFYKNHPINLRSMNTLVSSPGPKYRKCNFSTPGAALVLARKLNTMFETTDFTVRELVAGVEYKPKK